jgi:hypothetical protein
MKLADIAIQKYSQIVLKWTEEGQVGDGGIEVIDYGVKENIVWTLANILDNNKLIDQLTWENKFKFQIDIDFDTLSTIVLMDLNIEGKNDLLDT